MNGISPKQKCVHEENLCNPPPGLISALCFVLEALPWSQCLGAMPPAPSQSPEDPADPTLTPKAWIWGCRCPYSVEWGLLLIGAMLSEGRLTRSGVDHSTGRFAESPGLSSRSACLSGSLTWPCHTWVTSPSLSLELSSLGLPFGEIR